MKRSGNVSNKGILHAEAGRRRFALERFDPSPDLAFFVEHYWMVRWDLRGQAPYRQEILSYPSVNLVFEREGPHYYTGVYGVPPATYIRHLHGEGAVLGIKFRPGGFYPFCKQPLSRLTGLNVPCGELLGVDVRLTERRMFELESAEQMAELAESFLRERKPQRDAQAELAGQMTETVSRDRSICKVEELAGRFGLSVRALQRMFERYVGVSPKWVIRRFRLQEAAQQMESGHVPDWAHLAFELGYYDQAHFIKDFKSLIGKTPQEYLKELQIRKSSE